MSKDEVGFLVIGICLAIPVLIVIIRKVFKVNEIIDNQNKILDELKKFNKSWEELD